MRLCSICLVLLCVLHVSNTKPFLVIFDHINKHLENKLSRLMEMLNGNSDASSVPDNTKPNSNKEENSSPDKDEKKLLLNTLVKLCKSETGNDKPSELDVIVADQTISNLNTIKNNISMPEIQLPPITVVIAKNEKALAKYQEESKNSKSKNPVIIIKRPSRTKDTKPAPRSELKRSTKKGLTSDVKKCVLMKIKELNVVKA